MSLANDMLGHSPQELRRDARTDRSPHMRRRRATVAVSLLGIASMAFTTMLQMGMVRRLPDPPIRRFNTKRVNLSEEAFSYGGPDSPIVILMHAINMVLATTGGADRARHHPVLPILAASLAGAQSAMAAKYLFYQMPYVDEAYCPYCIVDAFTHFATLGLVLPEAVQAAEELFARR
jgi:uncharacterized membrane protein